MPLAITRFNAQPSHHPNHLISFVRPLPGPDSALAETYLHAVAAICLPVMKKYHLSVTTLEEHEPNREFIGRNFNNGEIIQLVLKNRSGGWVPFRHVQMVMMHELAHNVQMNHGKSFWVENNKFRAELKELWAGNYTGDGLWGRGRTADLEVIEGNAMMPTDDMAPLALCGGTYRSRRRKRKRGAGGEELTWKEQRDKRIEKKFGKNGLKLGEDDGARMMLEIGKRVGSGKPRVANSKRGRDLRAAAALARFGQESKDEEERGKQEDESDFESDEEDADTRGEDAKDVSGQRILDNMGFGMVRICGDEDANDPNVKQEMADFEALDNSGASRVTWTGGTASQRDAPLAPPATNTTTTTEDARPNSLYDIPHFRGSPSPETKPTSRSETPARASDPPEPTPREFTCPICTLTQPSTNVTCTACAHVLDLRRDPKAWTCPCSVSISGAEDTAVYLNAGDVGLCGACGASRAKGMEVR